MSGRRSYGRWIPATRWAGGLGVPGIRPSDPALRFSNQPLQNRTVIEQRLHVVGLLDLAEPNPPGTGAHEDTRPDHTGVHVEPVQVTQLDAGQRGVCRL